jgi:hypothetical protein
MNNRQVLLGVVPFHPNCCTNLLLMHPAFRQIARKVEPGRNRIMTRPTLTTGASSRDEGAKPITRHGHGHQLRLRELEVCSVIERSTTGLQGFSPFEPLNANSVRLLYIASGRRPSEYFPATRHKRRLPCMLMA